MSERKHITMSGFGHVLRRIIQPQGPAQGAEPEMPGCASQHHIHYATALPGLLAALMLLAGCATFEWKQVPGRYYAVERGRLIELIEVHVRVRGNPWNPWVQQLVEPCADRAAAQAQGQPCWPRDRSMVSQSLLRRIHNELDRSLPDILNGARYLNRDIGAFHPAWVVGTRPLAVAFRQGTADPHPYHDLRQRGITTRPTTTPGTVELVNQSGEVTLFDRRARHARFVTDADIQSEVDAVIVFPIEMHLPYGSFASNIPVGRRPPARVFYLQTPIALRTLMRAMTEPQGLEPHAQRIEELPVVAPEGHPAR